MPDSKGRTSYRVEYPIQERPVLLVSGVDMAVHDLSETGLRFATRIDFAVRLGERVRGVLRFRGRGELAVAGDIVWLRHSLAALEFDRPIPFGVLVAEQDYLRSRYRSLD